MARKYLERMIGYQSWNAKKREKARKANRSMSHYSPLHLLGCDKQEEIPYQVVGSFFLLKARLQQSVLPI